MKVGIRRIFQSVWGVVRIWQDAITNMASPLFGSTTFQTLKIWARQGTQGVLQRFARGRKGPQPFPSNKPGYGWGTPLLYVRSCLHFYKSSNYSKPQKCMSGLSRAGSNSATLSQPPNPGSISVTANEYAPQSTIGWMVPSSGLIAYCFAIILLM